MEETVNLRLGSQIVSAQHATGKGAVAVAERDSGSGVAVLRVGPAALANGRNCGIDEFQLFDFESQDQFASMMQSGSAYFAKMGIHQKIWSHTNFIITANPLGGNWKDQNQISIGDVSIKETLWDRQDFFIIFKSDNTDEDRDTFSKKKIELSRIQLRPGYSLAQKLVYLIINDTELQETKFTDPDEVERLRVFWNRVSSKYSEVMGNRSLETVFRTASIFARLMLKNAVDSEVVDETIDFLTKMYKQLDNSLIQSVDPRATAYEAICSVIKRHSEEQNWVKQVKPKGKWVADITFGQAAELACKNNWKVHEYIGDTYKSNAKRAAKNLRTMFRERQNYQYEGGKIRVTSADIHVEMTLRWIPDNVNDNNSTRRQKQPKH